MKTSSPSLEQSYVLSLTSHPPRFESLLLVLENIANWEYLPKKIYLNLSKEDIDKLPRKVFNSQYSELLKINEYTELGSAMKLIPTLSLEHEFPIVTIDDDILYDSGLVTKLLKEHLTFPNCIIAGRTHLITRDSNGDIKSYMEWDIDQSIENGPSKLLFPTGSGMVLYPQGCLDNAVADLNRLRATGSTHSDDIWHFFQARRKGTLVRQIPQRHSLNYIDGSQEVGLWQNGNFERNDLVIAKLVAIFGNPCNL